MAVDFHGAKRTTVVYVPVASGTVIEAGDLCYVASNALLPASSQADNVGEEDNQAEFAQNFAGIAVHSSADGETADVAVDTGCDVERTMTVPSGTYRIGSYLGASEASSGTALEDQQLEAVTSRDLAIAVVTDDSSSARTSVKCRLLRTVFSGVHGADARKDVNTETLSGAKVLTFDDAKFQFLDPGGAGRNVDLPAEEESAGLWFLIANKADAAEVLTIRNDAAATIATPTQAESALCFCDGTSWVGMVGSA